MANPAHSLGNLISWLRVLPALGVKVPTGILPATTTCPLCHGDSFQVLNDKILGGQWCSCRGCKFTGDLIELVARVWDIKIPAAIVRLGELDLLAEHVSPEDSDGYVRDHIQYRWRLHQFWELAQQQIRKPQSLSLKQLIQRFGMRDQICRPDWPQLMGRFVGGAHFKQVQELFHPGSYALQSRVNHGKKATVRRGAGPGDYRMFGGTEWEDVLVVPFFDVPGRISGFLFVGRNADPCAGDVIFKPANFQPVVFPSREAGLGMWDAMDVPPHPNLGNALFVLSDPLVALELQGRSFRDSFRPLPIVMSYCDAQAQTNAALAHLPNRNVIFWGKDSGTLKQAKAVGGRVSCYPISLKEIERHLHHNEPIHWLQLMAKSALPWSNVLGEQLRKCDQPTMEAIIRHLQFTPDELRQFAFRSDEQLRERIERMDTLRLSTRKVQVRGKTVVESESGWSLERTGEIICNGAIRIEEVLRTSDDTQYYRGTVRFGEADHRFTLPAANAEQRGLLRALREFLVEQDVGFLQFQHTWAKDSAYIALSLGKPKYRSVVDRIGWHPSERHFVFPKFSITHMGDVKSDGAPILMDNPPAANLMEPCFRPFMQDETEALCADQPAVSMFWAMGASILHNLLAPAMNHKPAGILLDGQGAQVTGPTLAKAMGCVEMDLRHPARGQSVLERINAVGSQHGWPTVLSVPVARLTQVSADWAEATGPQNAILSLNEYAALSLGTNAGFNLISSGEPAAPLDILRRAASKLIPAYLQDICHRRFMIDLTAVRMQDILRDLAGWFREAGGNTQAVYRAEKVLRIGGQEPWRPFVELVFRLYGGEHLHVVREGFQPRHPATAIVYRPATDTMRPSYSVPARSINRLLGRLGAPGVNLSKILESLTDVPGFLGANETGWSFEEGAWTTAYHEHCTQGYETQEVCGAPDATTSG